MSNPSTIKELVRLANRSGIRILDATCKSDAHIVAVHRLEPNEKELMNAIETAKQGPFDTIILHTLATWPGIMGSKSVPLLNKNIIYLDSQKRTRDWRIAKLAAIIAKF